MGFNSGFKGLITVAVQLKSYKQYKNFGIVVPGGGGVYGVKLGIFLVEINICIAIV